MYWKINSYEQIRPRKFLLYWLSNRKRCLGNWAIGYKTAILHKILRELHLKALILVVFQYLPYGRRFKWPLNQ